MEALNIERIEVGVRKIASRIALPLPSRFTVDCAEDWIADNIVYQLRGYMAAQAGGTVEFRAPADWWEAFKERWLPRWALRRWPIRYREERYQAFRYLPAIALPDNATRMEFIRWDPIPWAREVQPKEV